MYSKLRYWFVIPLAALLLATGGEAQSPPKPATAVTGAQANAAQGTIRGRITDPSGALIPQVRSPDGMPLRAAGGSCGRRCRAGSREYLHLGFGDGQCLAVEFWGNLNFPCLIGGPLLFDSCAGARVEHGLEAGTAVSLHAAPFSPPAGEYVSPRRYRSCKFE